MCVGVLVSFFCFLYNLMIILTDLRIDDEESKNFFGRRLWMLMVTLMGVGNGDGSKLFFPVALQRASLILARNFSKTKNVNPS